MYTISEIIKVKQIKNTPSHEHSPVQTKLVEAKWQTGYQLNLFEQTVLTEKIKIKRTSRNHPL